LKRQSELVNILLFAFLWFNLSCSSGKEESAELSERENFIEGLPNPIEFDLEAIQARGSVIALIDNNSFSYFLYKGQPLGFEYELLETMASKMGVKLEIKIEKDLDKLFERLLLGEGDVIAHNLTVTKSRRDFISFTKPFIYTRQVLIQRKPDGWETKKAHQIENWMIRSAVDLIGKEVVVRRKSAFYDRLVNLSAEIGGDIVIVEEDSDVETEELIDRVSTGDIDFTIADMNIATMAAAYYRNLDVKTELSTDQQIAWAVRPNSEQLLKKLNQHLNTLKSGPIFNVLYKKYFNPGNLKMLAQDFVQDSVNIISPYDELIKKYAGELDWDWKMLSAQIYRESRFLPKAVSSRGARGLLQIMPNTGREYGVSPAELTDPERNLFAGTKYLEFLEGLWEKKVLDSAERLKFVLASYNVGQGHVLDARRLARKYGDNPDIWDGHVAEWIKKKSYRKYYSDQVVQFGYCRGIEPFIYVQDILNLYQAYLQLSN
jgi:peptidoglycan lytic transglycosylase F